MNLGPPPPKKKTQNITKQNLLPKYIIKIGNKKFF